MGMFSNQEIEQFLSQAGVSQFRYFPSLPSTNVEAMTWLEQDAPDQAVVFADHQSAGRGRLQRTWITQKNSAIAVSVILRPKDYEKTNPALFSPLAGVALADMLRQDYHIPAQVKWPNDVLIHEAKTAGILSEVSWKGADLNGIVIGVGINITPESMPPSEGLQYTATCVQNHSNISINRLQFLAQFLQSLFTWRQHIHKDLFYNSWKKMLAFQDKNVYIKGNDGSILSSGKIYDILPNGDLQIITDAGQIRTFTVGDVHLRQADGEQP